MSDGCENWHTSNPVQGDYTEEYQAYYHEELIKQLFTRDFIWATHVWNMYDFATDARAEGGENGMNHKGLVTFDRSTRRMLSMHIRHGYQMIHSCISVVSAM